MADKYLKARLQEAEHRIPKMHSLIDLLAIALEIDGSFMLMRSDLALLERYAVRYR